MLQTEFPFVLPRGFVDAEGHLHREGVMRLSTAYDEVAPMKDPRVQTNPAYMVIILLSRVIVRLGSLTQLNPKMVEGFFSADLAFLQDFYRRVNEDGHARLAVTCPHCAGDFEVEVPSPGGGLGYPLDRLFEEVAYVAYYLHWPHDQIMALEHRDRQCWVAEVVRMNERLAAAPDPRRYSALPEERTCPPWD